MAEQTKPANLSEANQYPVNVIGPKGPNAFFGSHQAFFQGTTGLVATSYGAPGFTIGRLRTGVYGVRHPPVRHMQVWPDIKVPSGLSYDVSLRGMSGRPYNSQSGYFEVSITREEQAPVVTGTSPSTLVMHQNPPTGAVLDLLFYGSTVDPLGY